MRKTQTHRRQILGIQPIQKRSQLASNAPPQISLLVLARDRVDLDAELFGYRTREVRIDDDEVVLAFPLPDHLVREEFFEALAQFPVLERRDVFDGGCGRREAVQRLELESMHAHTYRSARVEAQVFSTYSLLALSGDSNSFHRSGLSSLAASVTLKRQ